MDTQSDQSPINSKSEIRNAVLSGAKDQKSEMRILLLIGGRTYRAQAFVQAAEKLGLEVVKGIDLPQDLAEFYKPTLPLQFANPERAAQDVIAYAKQNPVRAIISPDDDATVVAALASDELDLTNNSPDAAYAASGELFVKSNSSLARAAITVASSSTETIARTGFCLP